MKLLRNPIVTIGLVAVALGILGYRVWQSRWASGVSVNAKIAPPAISSFASSQTAPLLSSHAEEPTALPKVQVDFFKTHMGEWLDAPPRDPFLLIGQPRVEHAGPTESPVKKWKLQAIWRQTGGRVAAINKGVYKEGDFIEGYKIEKIENDRVWLLGNGQRETLGFESSGSHAANCVTNAAFGLAAAPST
jgi:hypothetical protein